MYSRLTKLISAYIIYTSATSQTNSLKVTLLKRLHDTTCYEIANATTRKNTMK